MSEADADDYGGLGFDPFAPGGADGEPVPIILDTDIGPDADDAGTVAMLHTLEQRGEARLLAMLCNTTCEWGAPCLSAINTYYGRPDLPLGTLKGYGPSGDSAEWSGLQFNRFIAEHCPNPLCSGRNADDAVTVTRRALANAAEHSVVIVSIGGLTNLRDLLVSGPDAESPLFGRELIARKVRFVSLMGGRYPQGPPECNLAYDVSATQTVLAEWPAPLIFCGFEVGMSIMTGARLWTETPPQNPVRIAYHLWDRHFASRFDPDFDVEKGIWPHSSYDQATALFAVKGLGRFFTLHVGGENHVFDDGANEWRHGPRRNRAYLVKAAPDAEIAQVIEEFMVAPPAAR